MLSEFFSCASVAFGLISITFIEINYLSLFKKSAVMKRHEQIRCNTPCTCQMCSGGLDSVVRSIHHRM